MSVFIALLYFINLVFALFLVFYKERDTSVTWAWLLVFVFIPFLGFFLYLFFGYGLSEKERFKVEKQAVLEMYHLKELYDPDGILYDSQSDESDYTQLAHFISELNQTPMTHHNDVTLLTDGEEKIEALLADFEQATTFIHLEYYAFVTDKTGMRLIDVLTEKAKDGVSVCLMYDELGSKGVKKELFNPLIEAGGKVATFITSQKAILKFRANYHNHRKIVIIDGKIGYIGGFNIADQYVETTKKFGYWRDTHIRIYGPATSLLEFRFLTDWNVSVPEEDKLVATKDNFYIGDPIRYANTDIQIVASGPHDEKQQIKLAFVKLILSAKKRVWIQTPYFIPDDTILDALRIARKSGVDVRIMIPDKPDHPFIYRATEYFSEVVMKDDISIYIYNGGFLHSKVLIMDDEVSMVGSANQDIRSYKLNFEASAVLYDDAFNAELTRAFERDLLQSQLMTEEYLSKMSLWVRFKKRTARLFSPIM